MHILAVIMLHQHKFCVHKRKRKLKLLITCENIVLFVLWQLLFCFVNIFLENVGKKFTVVGFREGWSGYSKHNFLFSPYAINYPRNIVRLKHFPVGRLTL